MSSEATAWAIAQRVGDPCRKLVLLGLASVASKTGEHSFPGVKTLAEDAECSTRTVQRHLKLLEEAGLIIPGDQRYVDHLPGNRRPTVYDLAMPRGDRLTPQSAARGDTNGVPGVTNGEITPHIETRETMETSRAQVDAGFNDFWAAYPKKAKKVAALKAYEKAVKIASEDPEQAIHKINTAARAYAVQRRGQDPKYTAHPTTWLNEGRWDDEDLQLMTHLKVRKLDPDEAIAEAVVSYNSEYVYR